MKILFVCKHNRFRSKVAEAIFKKLNKKIKVRSKATKPDYIPVAENVIKVLFRLGIKKIDRKPRKLIKKDLKWADLIVIVANNVGLNKKDVKEKRILIWRIPDTNQENYQEILRISKKIKVKVKKLILELNKKVY